VLLWARLGPDEEATPAPILTKRPDLFVDAVVRTDSRCEPADVIANRLDPWHGVHFHPYAFQSLEVTEATDDELRLDVTYAIGGRIRFPVTAVFSTPEPRTIVMTIVAGDGEGSVVETHATPIDPAGAAGGIGPRTAVIEATLATSDRSGFRYLRARPEPMRWILRRMARRLWVDDAAYAERRYARRTGEV
jgi:hypothetical protein